MGKKGNQVQETSQQRALADYASAQMADYKARWLPVQQNLAAQIKEMGVDGSRAEVRAEGRASNDAAASFGKAEGVMERALAKNVNLGSSRAKLAITGQADDEATSRGLGVTMADQQIDDAYTEGLSALAAAGRGERQAVGNSLMRQAESSGRQAAADAEASLMARAGNARVAGQAVGLGLQQGLGSLGSGGAPAGGYFTSDNPGGYAGAGMSGGYTMPRVGGP
ncbi:MAG: hypothetical protein RLZZ182_2224 [Pseudomonadota bacterium]|jgi:hypothetical protein